MNIDLSQFVPVGEALAKAALPHLGDLLGSVVPFPYSLAVKPAFTAIAAALGVDPNAPDAPQAVTAAIEADPAAATVKLQAIEDAHVALAQEATKQMAIAAGDTANARDTGAKLALAGNPLGYGAAVFTSFIALCVIALIAIGAAYPEVAASQAMLGWSETCKQLLVLAAGFWLGSSQGSRHKDGQLAAMASAPTIQAQAGSNVTGGVIKG